MQEQLLGTAAFSASRECQPDGLNLCMFIRQEGDVFMPHIVADRNYLFVSSESGERLVNRFSAVFVPGEWMKQRLLGSRSVTLRADQIFVVGSPRVDILRKRQAEVGAKQAAAKPSVLLAFGRQTKKKRGQVDEASVAAANARGALQLALREAGFEVLDVPHPCDRDDKQPIMDELLSADIVVSDTSSVVYEAWALGKPVIFPRWLVDIDNVVGAAGTAEALIYRNRIGLHAETLEELVDMAATDPTIGVDVDRFMTTYLDNYRSGNASQKVAKLLLRLSDPDTYEKESWAERQMAEVSGLARLRAPEKPDPIRVSIQLLQLQLINGHFEDFDASRRSLGLLPLNRSVSEGVSGLVLESSLMRGRCRLRCANWNPGAARRIRPSRKPTAPGSPCCPATGNRRWNKPPWPPGLPPSRWRCAPCSATSSSRRASGTSNGHSCWMYAGRGTSRRSCRCLPPR